MHNHNSKSPMGNDINDVIMAEAEVEKVKQSYIIDTTNMNENSCIESEDDDPKLEKIQPFSTSCDTNLPLAVEIEETEKGENINKIISLAGPSVVEKSTVDLLTVAADPREIARSGTKSVYDLEWVPLGFGVDLW